jgi:hypothetical protein
LEALVALSRTQVVLKSLSFKIANVTGGLMAPGVHRGSGTGYPFLSLVEQLALEFTGASPFVGRVYASGAFGVRVPGPNDD